MLKKINFSIVVIIFLLFIVCVSEVKAIDLYARSPKAIEYGFDLMETFDDLEDWTPVYVPGTGGHVDTIVSDIDPKRLDGSDTLFNTMDYWSNEPPPHPFIMNHSTRGGEIWDPNNTGAGKSLTINPIGTQQSDGENHGMTRFGVTLSETGTDIEDNAKIGYNDVYLFLMVYKPKEFYPTCVANRYGKSKEDCGGIESDCFGSNNPCGYFNNDDLLASGNYVPAETEKFITMGQAAVTPYTTYLTTHWDMDDSYPVGAYTGVNLIMYHGVHDTGNDGVDVLPELQFGPMHHLTAGREDYPCSDDYGKYDYPVNPYSGGHPPQDKWYGVEIRFTANTEVDGDGIMEMWWYDADGTEHSLGTRVIGPLMTSCALSEGLTMNRFFIGGNVSNTWSAGPGIKAEYYIDDFIINGSRIAPNYFAQKLGSAICETTPSICTTQTDCTDAGFNWCNTVCQLENCLIVRADVNQDSQINTTDAMLTLRNSLGLDMTGTAWQPSATTGDVNCDGVSNSTDAMLILRYSLGLPMDGTEWCG